MIETKIEVNLQSFEMCMNSIVESIVEPLCQ